MLDAAASPLTLGVDLGTSAVKVLALGADGTVLASGACEFATVSELPGQAEQDPADWIAALGHACVALDRNLAGHVPDWRDRVEAIGLAGQLPTLVCLGAKGPLGPAITWKDARTDTWALATIDAAERRALYERTGMPIDGRYLGPMFRCHGLDRNSAVESVFSAKDYLCYVLTGERLTDPSTAAGYAAFDLETQHFSTELAQRWLLPASALPSVHPAHALAGPLNAIGARLLGVRPGISVTVGAADSVASAYAMAGLTEGVACVTMGSSTVIIDAVRERRLDPRTRYLLTSHVEPGWYGREMDLLATGTGYRWLSGLFDWPDGALDQRAAESRAGARGLSFAPYLAGGEQGALWDPTLRGTLRGLTLEHAASDIARAFLEGVCFEIRRCLDVLAETATLHEIVVAGHIVERPSTLQLLASIVRVPVRPFAAVSPAALGAALGALKLVAPSRPLPAPASNASGQVIAPGPDRDRYEALYHQYVATNRSD